MSTDKCYCVYDEQKWALQIGICFSRFDKGIRTCVKDAAEWSRISILETCAAEEKVVQELPEGKHDSSCLSFNILTLHETLMQKKENSG